MIKHYAIQISVIIFNVFMGKMQFYFFFLFKFTLSDKRLCVILVKYCNASEVPDGYQLAVCLAE